MLSSALALLPRGYSLPEADWRRRHTLLLWVLAVHIPLLGGFGLVLQQSMRNTLLAVGVPAVLVGLGWMLRRWRRWASVTVTAGLVYCSTALVALTDGAIEAHFHFFIIIGFIALYQDWVPFLFNVGFTVLSHGLGSLWQQNLIFNHAQGQSDPWMWSLVHGIAVLAACTGMMVFWRVTEDQQHEKDALARELAENEIGRRKFTSDLLVNLARRNQSMLYRQLEIINQLEESERDPDALAELFKLDHITTRVRRNAESLLVLSGEQPPRVWSDPVVLRDVVRAAIAETEDLGRVMYDVDVAVAVAGHVVTDLTHLLAELTENAVRFSPPDAPVTIRSRADRANPGAHVLTVEDWGVGMPAEDIAAANELFARPPDVDLAVHQRLGFHVVARLAARHGVAVSLVPTPGSGVTAVVGLPAALFDKAGAPLAPTALGLGPERSPAPTPVFAGAFRGPAAHAAREPGGHRQQGGHHAAPPVAATLATAPTFPPAPEPAAERPAPRPRPSPEARDPQDHRDALPQREAPAQQDPRDHGPTPGNGPATANGDVRTSVEPGPWMDWPRLRDESRRLPTRTPAPRPAPPAESTTGGAGAPARPDPAGDREPAAAGAPLRRRVPQASLAPGLRTPMEHAPATAAPALDPAAASALSRFQASRRAAQEDLGSGDDR